MTLRKQAPFWCRHKTNDKFDCLTVPLTSDEGDLCKLHEKQIADARNKLFGSTLPVARPVSVDSTVCGYVLEIFPEIKRCGQPGSKVGLALIRCDEHAKQLPYWA